MGKYIVRRNFNTWGWV